MGNIGAYLGVIFVNIMWGLSFIGSKSAMAAGIEPFSLISLRFLTASLCLLPICLVKRTDLRIGKKDLPALVLSALLGVTVYFYFELNGLKRTSASTASLIIAAIPVLALLYAVLFRKKRPAVREWAGAVISLLGVYLVVSGQNENDTPEGILLMTGACLCWVAYMQLADKLLKKYSNLAVTFWQSVISLISLIPPALTEKVAWSSVPWDAWLWSCGFLGLICSALCYILYNQGIARISPERTALFLNLNPIASILGSVLILRESVTAGQIIGGVIILAAITFSTAELPRRRRWKDPSGAPPKEIE